MRTILVTLTLGLLGALPTPSHGVKILWDCDAAACTTATWHLSQAVARLPSGEATQTTTILQAAPLTTCQQVEPQAKAGLTYCADLGCLTDGVYTLALDAKAPGATFDQTNTLTFGIQACKLADYPTLADTVKPDDLTPAPLPGEPDAAPIPREDEASPVPVASDVPSVTPTPPPTTPTPVRPVPVAQKPPGTPPPVAQPTPNPARPVVQTPVRPVTTQPQPKPVADQPRPTVTPIATTPGVNLIPAPSTQQPWRSSSFGGTQGQSSPDTAMQRDGHPVQQLTGRGDYYLQTSTPAIAVDAGRRYAVSAPVKLQDITQMVELDVFWRDANGAELGWEEAVGGRLKGTHDWTVLQGEITAPPGATQAIVQVRVKSRGGKAWVDQAGMHLRAQGQAGVGVAAPPRDPEVTPAQPSPAGTGTPAPPRDPEVTPAQPVLPAKPTAPTPLPAPVPAQTRQGLREQFNVLEAQYQTAQREIRTTYDALLRRLAKDATPAAQQQRVQAYEQGTQALTELFKALEQQWDVLAVQWEEVS